MAGSSITVTAPLSSTPVLKWEYKGGLKIFKNPYCRKIKGSRLLVVSCGYCKAEVALYQKKGRGSLKRMYLERIVNSAVDLSAVPETLCCPACQRQLATRVALKRKNTEAYQLIRSAVNSKEL